MQGSLAELTKTTQLVWKEVFTQSVRGQPPLGSHTETCQPHVYSLSGREGALPYTDIYDKHS